MLSPLRVSLSGSRSHQGRLPANHLHDKDGVGSMFWQEMFCWDWFCG